MQNGSLLSAAAGSALIHVWGQTPLCTGDVIVYFRQTPLLPVIIETPHATSKETRVAIKSEAATTRTYIYNLILLFMVENQQNNKFKAACWQLCFSVPFPPYPFSTQHPLGSHRIERPWLCTPAPVPACENKNKGACDKHTYSDDFAKECVFYWLRGIVRRLSHRWACPLAKSLQPGWPFAEQIYISSTGDCLAKTLFCRMWHIFKGTQHQQGALLISRLCIKFNSGWITNKSSTWLASRRNPLDVRHSNVKFFDRKINLWNAWWCYKLKLFCTGDTVRFENVSESDWWCCGLILDENLTLSGVWQITTLCTCLDRFVI